MVLHLQGSILGFKNPVLSTSVRDSILYVVLLEPNFTIFGDLYVVLHLQGSIRRFKNPILSTRVLDSIRGFKNPVLPFSEIDTLFNTWPKN